MGGDGEAQDDVPEEGQALVGLRPAVNPRRVREGLPGELAGQRVQ